MSDQESRPTETEIIREQVQRAAEACGKLRLEGQEKDNRGWNASRAHELTIALYAIRDANEARYKAQSRNLSVQVQVPEMSEYLVRALLAIGYSNGKDAAVKHLVDNLSEECPGSEKKADQVQYFLTCEELANPFNQEAAPGSKFSRASTGFSRVPLENDTEPSAEPRCTEPGCKLHETHECKHTDGETEWPYTCACGYDHGDLGSDGLCVRCGGRVQK